MAAAKLPASVGYKGTAYPLKRPIGRGGSGSVGLYGSESLGYLVLKVSYCNQEDALQKSQLESDNAREAAAMAPCEAADVIWRRGAQSFSPREMLRLPLATAFRQGCAYALYDWFPQNLTEWLQSHPRRRPDDVVGIFLQLVSIFRCLKTRGFYYNDLKPSNLLVWQDSSDTTPRIKIGDLGGLDRAGDPKITVTPSRLPPKLLKQLTWQNIDVLGAFLLAELILQLLMRPPKAGERHAMNDFLQCMHGGELDRCASRLLAALRGRLADGLSFDDPRIRDLAALALNFLGFEGLYVSLDEALQLDSALWQGSLSG
jgi:serine/threonine protein kinase